MDGKMKNILIVDDEEDILFTIKFGLESINKDYKIKTAKDGTECLKILKKEIPDLILLDIMMPNMNGWQVLDIILENPKWRNIPVFIITGMGTDDFKEQAKELGITYIEKPFTVDVLKDKIENYFQEK
jgi:CheY-like chemotaxis protein